MTTCKSYLNGRRPVPVGCKYWDDCFTCKFKDCIAPTATEVTGSRRRGRPVLKDNMELFKKACELHDQGLRNIDIARALGKSDSVIYYWIRRYKEAKARGAI